MAFSMDQVKKEKVKRQNVTPKRLFAVIIDLTNISEDCVRLFYKYTQSRLNQFGTTGLSAEIFKFMLKDLIKKCCGVEYIDVTPELVDRNLSDMAFQLKWALQRNKTDKRTLFKHTIYADEDWSVIGMYLDTKPKKKVIDISKMSDEELEQYLEAGEW